MKNLICPYCGHAAEYVDSAEVYHGISYGMIYLCRRCNAYVGVHKGTDKPKGRMADARLRAWKHAAHTAFDPLWQVGKFRGRRRAAYQWLAQKMGLPPSETHIGMFDVEQCRKAINICNTERRTLQ